MSKLGEIYDFERQRALLSMVLLFQGLWQLVSGPEACLWAIYGQGCCPIIHKNVWPKCARTSQQELLLHVFLLSNACECESVCVCVCARINQRKWVWPTFTQLSGHQRPPASSFQMPQLHQLASRTNSQEAWFKKLLMWHMEYMEKVFDKWRLLCVCFEKGLTMLGLQGNLELFRIDACSQIHFQ